MRKNHLVIAILGSLLLALGAMQVMLYQRLTAMQKEIADLKDNRPGAVASHHEEKKNDPGTEPTAHRPPRRDADATLPRPKSETPEPKIDPAKPVNAGEVEDIVNRMLEKRDKKNPLARVFDFKYEDPMDVMKRELKLSPSQILRIEEHRKNRQVAFDDLHGSELRREDPKAWGEQWKTVTENYEAMVKSELDYNQQKTYDELKDSGKLMDFGGNASMHYVVGGVKTEKKED